MSYFYVSFSAAEGWIGSVMTEADSAASAFVNVTENGLNPGGSVAIYETPPEKSDIEIPGEWINRLFTTQAELEAFDRAMGGPGKAVRFTR